MGANALYSLLIKKCYKGWINLCLIENNIFHANQNRPIPFLTARQGKSHKMRPLFDILIETRQQFTTHFSRRKLIPFLHSIQI